MSLSLSPLFPVPLSSLAYLLLSYFLSLSLSLSLSSCSTLQVLGRAVLDARVCASPGRDRDLDETRLLSHATSPISPVSLSPSPAGEGTKRGRKRPAAITQSLEYSLPTKLFCSSSSQQKVLHTMEVTVIVIAAELTYSVCKICLTDF